MARKYRIDENGQERPVWMSKRNLQALGREEAAKAFRENRKPIHYGNIAYDTACEQYYRQLTRERTKD